MVGWVLVVGGVPGPAQAEGHMPPNCPSTESIALAL